MLRPLPQCLPGLATVDVRIVGPQSTHYPMNTQSPKTDKNLDLTIIAGKTLSLARDPLYVQGLQIVAVGAGDSLSLLPKSVEDGDWRVACSAQIDSREAIIEFDARDKGVLLAGGRLAKVTRLKCAVAEATR